MTKRGPKKHPSDYPILAFRCSQEEKEWVMNQIDNLYKKFNGGVDESTWIVPKGDLIMSALKIGIRELAKKRRLDD